MPRPVFSPSSLLRSPQKAELRQNLVGRWFVFGIDFSKYEQGPGECEVEKERSPNKLTLRGSPLLHRMTSELSTQRTEVGSRNALGHRYWSRAIPSVD